MAHVFVHLDPSWVVMFWEVAECLEGGVSWRKWVTKEWTLGFIICPHFLFCLCFLTCPGVSKTHRHSHEALKVPCLPCRDGLYPRKQTEGQMNPFSLKLLLIGCVDFFSVAGIKEP